MRRAKWLFPVCFVMNAIWQVSQSIGRGIGGMPAVSSRLPQRQRDPRIFEQGGWDPCYEGLGGLLSSGYSPQSFGE